MRYIYESVTPRIFCIMISYLIIYCFPYTRIMIVACTGAARRGAASSPCTRTRHFECVSTLSNNKIKRTDIHLESRRYFSRCGILDSAAGALIYHNSVRLSLHMSESHNKIEKYENLFDAEHFQTLATQIVMRYVRMMKVASGITKTWESLNYESEFVSLSLIHISEPTRPY